MSDDDPKQIPVDAPAADERVDIVSPEPEAPTASVPFEPAAGGGFVDQHPEALIGGAFAGAFVFAKLLQRIGRG